MASAHQIRDLITETTTGTVPPRVRREVRDEVCRYAARRREERRAIALLTRRLVCYARVELWLWW